MSNQADHNGNESLDTVTSAGNIFPGNFNSVIFRSNTYSVTWTVNISGVGGRSGVGHGYSPGL